MDVMTQIIRGAEIKNKLQKRPMLLYTSGFVANLCLDKYWIFFADGLECLQEAHNHFPDIGPTLLLSLGSQRLVPNLFRLIEGLGKVVHGRFGN